MTQLKSASSGLNVQYVTTDKIAMPILKQLAKEKYLGFDTETTGLNPNGKHERLRLVQFATPDCTYVFDIWKLKKAKALIAQILSADSPMKIGHNLKFDIAFVRHDLGVKRFGKLFDTMVAAQILSFGFIYSGFSLQDVVLRFLGVYVEKEEQLSDWSAKELTREQIEYAAEDAHILLELSKKQIEEIRKHNLIRTMNLEFDCVEPVGVMQYNGIRLDAKRWLELYHDTIERRNEVADMLYAYLDREQQTLFEGAPRGINLNSRKQLVAAFQALGVELPEDDSYSDGVSTRSYKLASVASQSPAVPLLIEYRFLEKRITSYGLKWLEAIHPDSQRIHASYNQMGAHTTRFAAFNPNTQQIPKDSEYRGCVMAGKGKRLGWADYSQIELRILAEFSGDEAFQRAYLEGKDLHQETAAKIFDKDFNDVLPEERQHAKNMNFLTVYGGGAGKLAESSQIPIDKAVDIQQKWFAAFPRVKGWLDAQAKHARFKRKSWTAIGRIIEYKFDPNNKKAASTVERNGKNTPIQGSSCDILKRALRLIHNEIAERDDIKLIHIIHDEIVLEYDKHLEDEARTILVSCMERAAKEFLKVVPIKVDFKSGLCWKK